MIHINTPIHSHTVQMWHELRNVLMVTILLMLYLVLWVPYVILVKGDQVCCFPWLEWF